METAAGGWRRAPVVGATLVHAIAAAVACPMVRIVAAAMGALPLASMEVRVVGIVVVVDSVVVVVGIVVVVAAVVVVIVAVAVAVVVEY